MIRLLYPMLTFSMFDAYSAERLARWSPALVVGVGFGFIAYGVFSVLRGKYARLDD